MTATIDAETAESFRSLNPATGEVVGEHPIHGEDAVNTAIDRARAASIWWAGLGWKERRTRLLNVKGALTRGLNRMATLIHQETGKPIEDAQLEVVTAITHLDWAARNAKKVLGPRGVFPGLVAINQKCVLEYQPLGVVGVIGPWNYPLFTPMGSIAYALAAGNAVVFKPSEYTPGVALLLAEIVGGVVPEEPVLQVVTGLGETGAALARGAVDKIAFTGSAPTARKVMAACATRLTPIVAECGGKDAFIVDADADVEAAAEAALWGAMSNAGQTCVGVERVYVVDSVYETFVDRLAGQAKALRPGEDRTASYGPITMPGQLDVIKRHIDDALARGGTAIVGGPESVKDPYVEPVILLDVPDDSPAVCEETFGPTITVHRVENVEEAVNRANATAYGLAGSVFSGSRKTAMKAARRLRSGMTSINAVIAFAAVPALPFGGVGDSGFGRIHGADGLREFARAKSITRQRFSSINVTSFKRTDKDMARLLQLVNLLHAKRYKGQRMS
jgi:acyl-CoA reductase-like NAD-dependent aldehyde dehydrogenase